MYDLQIGAIFYSRLVTKNVAVEIIKENKVEKVSGSGLTFEDLQTVYSRLGNKGLIAILAQPPSSSPTIAILTSDHHGSNFSYNSQVLRRKHPGSGIKLNPLSLLFQPARYHRNNTNKGLQNNGFVLFKETTCFQQLCALCACGRDGSRAYLAHTTPNHTCFSDFCDVKVIS